MEVYHYTSEEGLNAILMSGYIEESKLSPKDAFFGEGVYLTTLTPAEGRKKIAHNNYGTYLGQKMEEVGKVERAIRLWIPGNRLERADCDRDVLVHRGRVYLRNYTYETERLDQGEGDGWCVIL